MRRTNLSTAFYVLLVFVSGAVVGGFAHRLYMLNSVVAVSTSTTPKPEDWRRDYLNKMQTRLSLGPQQMTQLGAILDATRSRGRELKAKSEKEALERLRPEMKVIQEEQVKKISDMLTATQRPEYEKLRIEMRQQREKHRQEQQKNNAAKPALPPGD